MNRINYIVILSIVIGVIASTSLMMTFAVAQQNMSMEMPNSPGGMKNLSTSVNDIRNSTIGMDNTPFS